jgi:hypothetical protein
VATNDIYLRPDAGDGVNGVRLRTDAPDSGGTVNYTLVCAAGAYSYLGQAAALSLNHSLVCTAGAYTYTGNATALSLKHNLLCASGVYAYAGLPATLSVQHSLVCDSGAYTYSGVGATLLIEHSLSCGAGAYVLSGADAILTVSSAKASDYELIRGGSDKKKKHTDHEKALIGVAQLESLNYQQRLLQLDHDKKLIAEQLLAEIDDEQGGQLGYDDEDDILAILLLLD